MAHKMSWRTLLGGVPKSDPPQSSALDQILNADNVVPFKRMSLDELEQRGRELQNSVVDAGIEVERAVTRYNTTRADLEEWRAQFLERLKESGVKGEFPLQFPEADLMDGEPDESV